MCWSQPQRYAFDMDRRKRPFFSLKTPKKDGPSRDKVLTEKSFKDKVNLFENAAGSEDSKDGGKFRNNII